jgi:peroxiredoxin
MTIKVGEKVPSVTLMHMTEKGPAPVTTDELFSKKKVVLFALPGAFTPTCSARHLPGYVEHTADFAKKGVDIGGIAEPRNEREWQLFNHAYMIALKWHIMQKHGI